MKHEWVIVPLWNWIEVHYYNLRCLCISDHYRCHKHALLSMNLNGLRTKKLGNDRQSFGICVSLDPIPSVFHGNELFMGILGLGIEIQLHFWCHALCEYFPGCKHQQELFQWFKIHRFTPKNWTSFRKWIIGKHDFHHSHNVGAYGFYWTDWLFGTINIPSNCVPWYQQFCALVCRFIVQQKDSPLVWSIPSVWKCWSMISQSTRQRRNKWKTQNKERRNLDCITLLKFSRAILGGIHLFCSMVKKVVSFLHAFLTLFLHSFKLPPLDLDLVLLVPPQIVHRLWLFTFFYSVVPKKSFNFQMRKRVHSKHSEESITTLVCRGVATPTR